MTKSPERALHVLDLLALSQDKKELREFAHGWLLLSPTFAPYLTEKGKREAEELRRSLGLKARP